MTVVVQNAEPFTYFREQPDPRRRAGRARHGLISIGVLKRATVLDLPTLIRALLSGKARRVMRNRQVERASRAVGRDGRGDRRPPVPLQVDGDYIGDFAEVEFGVSPRGLMAVA